MDAVGLAFEFALTFFPFLVLPSLALLLRLPALEPDRASAASSDRLRRREGFVAPELELLVLDLDLEWLLPLLAIVCTKPEKSVAPPAEPLVVPVALASLLMSRENTNCCLVMACVVALRWCAWMRSKCWRSRSIERCLFKLFCQHNAPSNQHTDLRQGEPK